MIRLAFVAALLIALVPTSGSTDAAFSEPFVLSSQHPAGTRYMDIRLLGTVRLHAPRGRRGRPHQLSGLAWDADEHILYALSDEAYIVHLEPHFGGGQLTHVSLLGMHRLRAADGKRLRGRFADAEGLAARHTRNGVRGDTELVVSFEVEPRIEHFRPDGRYLSRSALPAPLTDPSIYASANAQLEALTESARFGLITGPERPFKSRHQRSIPLYSSSGVYWNYPLADPEHSALVGLETVSDEDILILERRYASLLDPMIISLKRTTLTATPGTLLAIKEVARFDSSAGWAVDNFEGIARHEGACYFMVSDDNRKFFQRTLLTYFELIDDGVNAPTLNAPTDAASAQPGCTGASDNRVDAP